MAAKSGSQQEEQQQQQQQKQQHQFYFVAYPFLELPEMQSAEREFAKKRQIRSEIIEALKSRRRERSAVLEKIKPLNIEENAYKERRKEINGRLSELQFNFKNVRVQGKGKGKENSNLCSSEAEIDQAMRKLEFLVKEGRNTKAEENHFLKEIKDLERSRGQILSLEDFNLKMKLKEIWNEKQEFRDIDSQIRSLENDLQYYKHSMEEDYTHLQQLRHHRYQNNEVCLQMRAVKDDALFDYNRGNCSLSDLENRSRLQVEEFMRMWNGSKEFREEYERRKSNARTSPNANA